MTWGDITKTYFLLSLTSFGGPTAHVAMFLDVFVHRLQWLDESTFAELFAICQSLPGPASTQLAYCIALIKGGFLKAIYAFVLWSGPGFVIMTLLGILVGMNQVSSLPEWCVYIQNGLVASAVGLICLAAYRLSDKLLKSKLHIALGFVTFSVAILTKSSFGYPLLLAVSGLIVMFVDHSVEPVMYIHQDFEPIEIPFNKKAGFIALLSWLLLLIGSSIVIFYPSHLNQIIVAFSTYFFTGSIIFGGGPVVIPMLQQYTLQWVNEQEFLLGLAFISILPGPMFNLAAYLGALTLRSQSILGAFIAYLGIFVPGLCLKTGVLPFWTTYRQLPFIKSFFNGVNSSAVGLVYAAAYLLWQNALMIGDKVVSIGTIPLFVVVCAGSIVLGKSFQVGSPWIIMLGGLVGLMNYHLK